MAKPDRARGRRRDDTPTGPSILAHPDEALLAAWDHLVTAVRQRVRLDPGGHLLLGTGDEVELRFTLPADPLARHDATSRARAAADLRAMLERGVATLLRHRAAWSAGHVPCRRCGATHCEHSAPASPRHVFVGWGPSGLPRFVDFGQYLLERRDPRVDRLFAEPVEARPRPLSRGGRPGAPAPEATAVVGDLVTRLVPAAELEEELLPAYRTQEPPRVVAQLVAGWFRAADHQGIPSRLAITIQVLASPSSRGRHRLGLNLVGCDPAKPAAALSPWAEPLAWAQGQLRRLAGSTLDGAALEQRVHGLLRSLAARLEHDRRARGRRTTHAEERHRQGDRPTRQALADAARATVETTFVDTRRGTVVVLGERGRAHVFSPSGRLVTSLRADGDALARRRVRGLWRPAQAAELNALRESLAGLNGADAPVPGKARPESPPAQAEATGGRPPASEPAA